MGKTGLARELEGSPGPQGLQASPVGEASPAERGKASRLHFLCGLRAGGPARECGGVRAGSAEARHRLSRGLVLSPAYAQVRGFPSPTGWEAGRGSACGRRAGLRTRSPPPCSQLWVLVCASQPAVWASAGHGKGNTTVTETAPAHSQVASLGMRWASACWGPGDGHRETTVTPHDLLFPEHGGLGSESCWCHGAPGSGLDGFEERPPAPTEPPTRRRDPSRSKARPAPAIHFHQCSQNVPLPRVMDLRSRGASPPPAVELPRHGAAAGLHSPLSSCRKSPILLGRPGT
ncbi:uncharacterized protein LOC125108643 [Lutra lutra]|uniref:uncharacterized protein LOC125108643 n=1 Tax=Lutra lutra TaxID=9657 RepID=UPI001FD476D6|nr:uncharacterized protein LOC125108643 [Lutra lutra]